MNIAYARIEGKGPFPLDMLRYDSCCPSTEVDACAIEKTILHPYKENWNICVKKILQTKRKKNESVFTEGRWNSFSCQIKEVDSPYQKIA